MACHITVANNFSVPTNYDDVAVLVVHTYVVNRADISESVLVCMISLKLKLYTYVYRYVVHSISKYNQAYVSKEFNQNGGNS